MVASSPGTVASDAITEASGIAASRAFDDVYWVHNDSGDTARCFAISGTGQTLGEFALVGRDGGRLGGHRGRVRTRRRASPPSTSATSATTRRRGARCRCTGSPSRSWTRLHAWRPPQTLAGVATLNLKYPDGPHDAEALLVDPATGDLFVVTKDLVGGVAQVFRAPANLAGGARPRLTQVATVSLGAGQGVTGADMTPAGDVIALRTYFGVFLYPRPAGASAQAFAQARARDRARLRQRDTAPSEPQGEALGFTRDGRGYVTLSEGVHAPLHRFIAP